MKCAPACRLLSMISLFRLLQELRDIVGLGVPMLPDSPPSHRAPTPPPPPPKRSNTLAPKPPPHPPPNSRFLNASPPPQIEDAEHVEVRVDQAFVDWARDFALPSHAKASPPPPPLPRAWHPGRPQSPPVPLRQAPAPASGDPHEQNQFSSLRSAACPAAHLKFCVMNFCESKSMCIP